MIFAKEATNSWPPELYLLIHKRRKTYLKETWKLVKDISYLKQSLKKYYGNNLSRPTATSLSVDKSALLSLITTC